MYSTPYGFAHFPPFVPHFSIRLFSSRKWTGWLFVTSLLAVGLLFWHHMTSGLNINL